MKASLWRVTALAMLDAAALAFLWPTVRRVLVTSDAVLHESTDGFAADLAGVGLFTAAVWLGVGLVASALTTLPGLAGRVGEAVSGVLLPGLLRRALAGGVGLGVLLAPVVPAVGSAAASAAPAAAHQPTPLPPPVWPTSTPAATTTPAPPTSAHPAPQTRVSVTAGDSLWLIAARRLGPDATASQIAAYWPRIYRQNRSVIGDDPDLVQPGQHLTLPVPSAKESSR